MARTPKGINTKTVNGLRKIVEFHKSEIAKHRDALREILEDAEAVCDSSNDAVDLLEGAIDRLSEYV